MVSFWNILQRLVKWGNRLIAVLGVLFCIIGIAGIILSIIELFHGRPSMFHYNESEGGLKIENPLWPSSGKGFWVGLILLSTGLVGILSSRERTRPSYVAFTAFSGASTILSFYLMMTCIIPVQYDTKYSDSLRLSWQSNELIINSLLIAVGGAGLFNGVLSTVMASLYAGCWDDQRDVYENIYSDDPSRIL